MPLHIAAIKQNDPSSSYSYVNQPFQEVHLTLTLTLTLLGFDRKYMDKNLRSIKMKP